MQHSSITIAEEYFSVLYKNQNNGHVPPYYGHTPPESSRQFHFITSHGNNTM